MFLWVSKYLPNAIFHNVKTNMQCTNITDSMNWHNSVELPSYVELAFSVTHCIYNNYDFPLCNINKYVHINYYINFFFANSRKTHNLKIIFLNRKIPHPPHLRATIICRYKF